MIDKALKLSIVIPVYNEEDHIKACLDSIAHQTETPNEVIVVDNNSSDKTAQIAKSYKFVKLLHEPHQGIVYARDAGFNAARSNLIGRIDADTILSNDWTRQVKNQYQSAGSPSLYAATGPSAFQNTRSHHLWYPLHRVFYFWSSRLLMGHNTLSGSNMFITRQLWVSVRSNVCVRTDVHEDMDLALHINKLDVEVNFLKSFKNSMAGRKVFHKLKNYPPMWLKIKIIDH